MGITLDKLDSLRARGLLTPGCKVLDIGSSNLYSAQDKEIDTFLSHYGKKPESDFVRRLASGSDYGPLGTPNLSFVGEILERAGLTYLSFDIANGYRTRIFDLNVESLPKADVGRFDIVMNFGTTEHVINQLNAFRVIHDAVKVGGFIVHEVPTAGYIDHGYFCYTPRFFFDLAGWNEYEVVEFAYHGPVAGNDIYGIVRDYQSYFPALANRLPEYRKDLWARISRKLKRKTPEIRPDNIASYLVLRKVKDLPLRLPSETSTSVHVA